MVLSLFLNIIWKQIPTKLDTNNTNIWVYDVSQFNNYLGYDLIPYLWISVKFEFKYEEQVKQRGLDAIQSSLNSLYLPATN